MVSYDAFIADHPDAAQLINGVVRLLGRYGQCGTLNPAIGYALRQKGLRTVLVTGQIACTEAPVLKQIEAGFHLWLLVADADSVWHVDAANPFLLNRWYHERLPPEHWERIASGKELAPPVPIGSGNFLWGKPSAYGITIEVGSLATKDPYWDVLDDVGQRKAVRDLFICHGFEDPHVFAGGILHLTRFDACF